MVNLTFDTEPLLIFFLDEEGADVVDTYLVMWNLDGFVDL